MSKYAIKLGKRDNRAGGYYVNAYTESEEGKKATIFIGWVSRDRQDFRTDWVAYRAPFEYIQKAIDLIQKDARGEL
jgi:hypothetical protein